MSRPMKVEPLRTVEDGALVSADLPPMRMEVDPTLGYLGASELDIKGIAHAERHYFVQARDFRVRRMLVVQFEGFLPTNDETYRYSLPDPVELGGEEWGTWVFCYSLAASTAPETLDTNAILRRSELDLHDELITVRFGRIVGPDARDEVLIFYSEPLRHLGHSLASLAIDDGSLRPQHAAIATDLKARARRAFSIG